jgi:hypothetical protein
LFFHLLFALLISGSATAEEPKRDVPALVTKLFCTEASKVRCKSGLPMKSAWAKVQTENGPLNVGFYPDFGESIRGLVIIEPKSFDAWLDNGLTGNVDFDRMPEFAALTPEQKSLVQKDYEEKLGQIEAAINTAQPIEYSLDD